MIAQFVVLIVVLICVVIGTASRLLAPAIPLQRFLPPKTTHLRPILRRYDLAGPPKRGGSVSFSSDIGVRTIDKRGRVRDRVGLINDMKRPRVPRSRGDTYPAAPPTQSIPSTG